MFRGPRDAALHRPCHNDRIECDFSGSRGHPFFHSGSAMRVFEGASALAALPSRVHLAGSAARRFIARTFRGDPLDRDKYAAFISYRHIKADRGWAIWVHNALESYVIPKSLRDQPYHKRIGRVFRDEEELAASTHLGENIREALRRSDWLIVVCSPRSKERPYVNAEVDYFRELGRGDRILALLIEGEPATAFPPEPLRDTPIPRRSKSSIATNRSPPMSARMAKCRTPENQALRETSASRSHSRPPVQRPDLSPRTRAGTAVSPTSAGGDSCNCRPCRGRSAWH